MEQVRQLIIEILNCDDNVVSTVISRLVELGVTSVTDLVEVQVSDLTPNPLLPVPARKLVRQWSNPHNEIGHVAQSSSAVATPDSHHLPSASTYSAVVPVTPTATPLSSDNYSSNWAQNFDVQRCISEMSTSSELPVRNAARNLLQGKILRHAERNEVIRFLVDAIRKVCGTPSRKSVNTIAEAVVSSYPKLRDEAGDIVIGPGFLSVRNQLESRINYVRRPLNNERRHASARRRIDVDNEASDTVPKNRIRDGYGCVDFLPVAVPDGETAESLKQKHDHLKTLHCSNSWNSSEITELMNCTYILQRQDLVGTTPLSVRDIAVQWPFLCKPKWMIDHLTRLLGINVLERIESSLMAKKDLLVQFFQSVAPTMKEVQRKLMEFDVTTQPVVGVISLLMAYFGEQEGLLFQGHQLMPDSTDIEISEDTPGVPCLMYEGSSLHTSTKFRVVVDRVVICSVETPMAGFAMVFGSYFLFNISYPTEAGATLEYVQRVLLGVNPSTGSKVARVRGKKVTPCCR